MAEKLKKGEVKIRKVQREKIAGKLENVMCRCRRAKAEETYVECSSCSDARNDFSWWQTSCAGFSRLSATSLRDSEFKCPVCIIRCGFKGDLELGDSGLTTVSSNDSEECYRRNWENKQCCKITCWLYGWHEESIWVYGFYKGLGRRTVYKSKHSHNRRNPGLKLLPQAIREWPLTTMFWQQKLQRRWIKK